MKPRIDGRQLAILVLLIGLVLIVSLPVSTRDVPLWYTQGDTLKASITKQWLTFGKIRFNRDGRAAVDTLTATTIIGSTQLRDTASFADSSQRKAVYIAGAKSTDIYTATVRLSSDTIPTAVDVIQVLAKADSAIAYRSTYNVLNLKFTIHRDR